MTFAEELKSRNFSIYGQWTGVLCIIICTANGIANIFGFPKIIFAIICLVCAPIILFVEVPFLLRICPTNAQFDARIRQFTTNWMRAVLYLGMSAIQWVSIPFCGGTTLIMAAVFLLFASIFYGLAGLKGHDFQGSKMLGGQGVAQMIV